ncbi:hypothetical protein EVAR_4509_1 [Eumeta japonica]|uniref:Uncharacterized protein n=1 Tax=Eumeta variegata TaxID=151549 RepID=A0A4C1SVT5_EUMVA|nr:hypothetical protein EVAR_4509_1 [Eumeta japonica]
MHPIIEGSNFHRIKAATFRCTICAPECRIILHQRREDPDSILGSDKLFLGNYKYIPRYLQQQKNAAKREKAILLQLDDQQAGQAIPSTRMSPKELKLVTAAHGHSRLRSALPAFRGRIGHPKEEGGVKATGTDTHWTKRIAETVTSRLLISLGHEDGKMPSSEYFLHHRHPWTTAIPGGSLARCRSFKKDYVVFSKNPFFVRSIADGRLFQRLPSGLHRKGARFTGRVLAAFGVKSATVIYQVQEIEPCNRGDGRTDRQRNLSNRFPLAPFWVRNSKNGTERILIRFLILRPSLLSQLRASVLEEFALYGFRVSNPFSQTLMDRCEIEDIDS